MCVAVGFIDSCSDSAIQNRKSQRKDDPLELLGRHLFYDRRLSVNNTKACATCHAQEFSFTDSYTRSIGALGDLHQRNARPLINLTFNKYFTSSDSAIQSLLQQMNKPMFNQHPVEMGIKGNEETVLNRIKNDRNYQWLFKKAFPDEARPVSIKNIQIAIEAFEKTIISFNAPYDKFIEGQKAALSKEQQEGMKLFYSVKLKCSQCHGGKTFSIPEVKLPNGQTEYYFNTGLYNINNNYPAYDQGLFELTMDDADKGKYRVPTLRNLVFTAPYFHDGSAASLDEVLAAYENGGRNITEGVYKGDGRKNVYKSHLIQGFQLTLPEKKALISFLFALSDSTVLHNPAYANPFKEDETKQ